MWAQLFVMTPLTKVLLMVITTAFISFWVKMQKKHASLNQMPGPLALPLVGGMLHFVYHGGNLMKTCRTLAEKYGGIYKIPQHGLTGEPFVFISKPEYLQTYYTSKTNIDKSGQYELLAEGAGDCLFIAPAHRWKKLREMAMTSFFNTPPQQLLPAIIKESTPMVERFRKLADGNEIPALHILQSATLRSMNWNTLGEPITEQFESVLDNVMNFLMRISYQKTMYIKYSPIIFPFLPTGRRYYKDIKVMDQVIVDVIKEKKAKLQELKDNNEEIPHLYIYRLIESGRDETNKSLADELKFMFLSGADTSVVTMGFMLTLLGMYPDVQQKVFEEDAEIQKMLEGREPTYDDLKNYKYLDMVMRETLRIFPVGPLIARKLTEDTYFGKYLVPKGTDVGALQIHANLNPTNFPDPMKFNPDRFLPENMRNWPAFAFNPFSGGPRGCPGSRYATMGIKINISTLVRNFKISSGYTSIQEALDNADAEVTLKDKRHCPLRLLPR